VDPSLPALSPVNSPMEASTQQMTLLIQAQTRQKLWQLNRDGAPAAT
jgi:hypothetical protein